MANPISRMGPVEYMMLARWCFLCGVSTSADDLLKKLQSDDGLVCELCIPSHIPERYHARMHRAWRMFVARKIFQEAKQRIDYTERYRLAQKIKQGVKGRDGR